MSVQAPGVAAAGAPAVPGRPTAAGRPSQQQLQANRMPELPGNGDGCNLFMWIVMFFIATYFYLTQMTVISNGGPDGAWAQASYFLYSTIVILILHYGKTFRILHKCGSPLNSLEPL